MAAQKLVSPVTSFTAEHDGIVVVMSPADVVPSTHPVARAHPELFQPGAVAGAPPDKFSARGQLWGNPLYDWPALQRRRYRWWGARLSRTLELFGTPTTGAPGAVAVRVERESDLSDIVRALDAEDLHSAHVQLHAPSLDDVFLAKTGRSLEGATEEAEQTVTA